MHFTTALTALLSATAISASPVTGNTKRECSVQYPSALGFPINYSISKTINPPSEVKNSVSFNLPPNAGGPCSLVVKFPPGYPIKKSGSSRVDIHAVDGPAAGALVGSVDFTSNPDTETVTTINSFACRTSMNYELSIESDWQDGSVAFSEIQGAGLVMTYGC